MYFMLQDNVTFNTRLQNGKEKKRNLALRPVDKTFPSFRTVICNALVGAEMH